MSALAIVTPFVPQAGPNRFAVAAMLGLLALPAHFIVRWVKGNPNPTGWLDLIAVVAASTTAIIEPAAFVPAFFFQTIHLIGAIPFLSTRWAYWLGGGSFLSMLTIAIVLPVDPISVAMLVIAGILLPAVFLGTTRRRLQSRWKQERIAAITASLPTALWEADLATGDMLTVLGAPERVLFTTVDRLVGTGYVDRIDSRDQEAFKRRFSHGDRCSLTYRFHGDRGAERWLTDQVEEVEIDGQKVLRGITIDVTQLHRTQESLVRQSEIVERMSATTIVLTDEVLPIATIISISDPRHDLLDNPRAAVGLPFGAVFPELAKQHWLAEGIEQLTSSKTVHAGAQELHRPNSDPLIVDVQLFSMPDRTTALIIENVTSRERAQATIRFQALHDSLTHLPNRSALMEEMERFIEEGRPFTFAMLDLNRFKAVNDTLGHLTGDELLQIVASRLSNSIGEGDVVARLGGDEFAIIFSHQLETEIDERLDAVLRACRDRVSIDGSSISVGVSIGLVSAPNDGSDPETLLRLADVAMYDAKRSRSTVQYYEASFDTSPERLGLMAELDEAFATGQFVPYFQAKCDTLSGAVIGAEALVRWEHPVNGTLVPAEFMELIAVSGRFDDLLRAVLWPSVQAISQMPDHLHVAINLSAVNLLKTDTTLLFRQAIETFNIAPARLTVELTESEFMDDTGRVEASLQELSELGVGVAVDDFGTGYSSLSHLRSLPLTELKVDRQFVSSMAHSPPDRVVVQALVGLAHDLGLTLTAEGVEDEATLNLLQEMGCDTVQGYLFARPVPIDDFSRDQLTNQGTERQPETGRLSRLGLDPTRA